MYKSHILYTIFQNILESYGDSRATEATQSAISKYDKKHLRNLRRYQSQVDALYDVVYRELANLIRTLDITDDAFTLARHPILAARLDTILAKYGLGMETIIVNGVDSEWTLSNNHTTHDSKGHIVPLYDICDELQGKYPKDFKFVGWHPHCRCYATTILKTEEELMNGTKDSSKTVKDVPPAFRGWVERNGERIRNAKSLPYFIRDNADRYLPGVRFTKAATEQIREAGILTETDRPNRKEVRQLYSEWCKNHLTNVKMKDGSVAKRMTIRAQDKDVIINRSFFDETFSKCTRGDDFGDVIDAALHIDEWLPSAELADVEKGIHHDFDFLVFNAKYKGIDVELKVKITEGLFAYVLKKKK